MSHRRTARVASMIREVVSEAILTELRDPRIRNVTVLGAEVSPDLRYATVRVSVRGDARQASLTMHGLNSARGYLQSKVADFVRTRYTPELRFQLDSGIQKSFEVTRILNELEQDTSVDGEQSDAASGQPENPTLKYSADSPPSHADAESGDNSSGESR